MEVSARPRAGLAPYSTRDGVDFAVSRLREMLEPFLNS